MGRIAQLAVLASGVLLVAAVMAGPSVAGNDLPEGKHFKVRGKFPEERDLGHHKTLRREVLVVTGGDKIIGHDQITCKRRDCEARFSFHGGAIDAEGGPSHMTITDGKRGFDGARGKIERKKTGRTIYLYVFDLK
jgi:hypothetical protein